MQKPESCLGCIVQAAQISARCFQQAERAIDIGANKIPGAMDRAINVTLGSEMHDGAWPVPFQQRGYQSAIADITLDKDMTDIAGQRGEIGRIACRVWVVLYVFACVCLCYIRYF